VPTASRLLSNAGLAENSHKSQFNLTDTARQNSGRLTFPPSAVTLHGDGSHNAFVDNLDEGYYSGEGNCDPLHPHEESFKRLQSVAEIKALIGTTEDLHLDCKVWPPSENDAQKVLAKALCGFANADGGVIIIGMEAKGGPNKDDPDLIQRAQPVTDALAVRSRIENLIGQLVEPGLEGVRVATLFDQPGSQSGFVLVDVPPTEGLPCRSRKDWKFYLRISAGTLPMEYFQIADMFGKRRRPSLKLYLEPGGIEMRSGRPVRLLILGIENRGRAVARFPSIQFRRSNGLGVDGYGIDGNRGFGLPERPSDPEWILFGGGADHVVHPGSLLKIARLEQYPRPMPGHPPQGGRPLLYFEEITLDVLLAGKEFPTTADSRKIPSQEAKGFS
jgi:hypothetical protein